MVCGTGFDLWIQGVAEADLKANICDKVYTHDDELLCCDVVCHCPQCICALTVFRHGPRLRAERRLVHGSLTTVHAACRVYEECPPPTRYMHHMTDLETKLAGVFVLNPGHYFGCSSLTQTDLHDGTISLLTLSRQLAQETKRSLVDASRCASRRASSNVLTRRTSTIPACSIVCRAYVMRG